MIAERVYQVVEDMLRIHDLNNRDFDEVDPGGQLFKKLLGQSVVPTIQQIKPLLANPFLVEICYLISQI